jgi:hypothetical protein
MNAHYGYLLIRTILFDIQEPTRERHWIARKVIFLSIEPDRMEPA